MIDADNFKRLNDAHGHLVGDNVLKAIVARIRLLLRPNDILVGTVEKNSGSFSEIHLFYQVSA
jgi:GGDEF domain-containing protein